MMGFQQPAVAVDGNFEQAVEAEILVRHDGSRPTETILNDGQISPDDGIMKADGYRFALFSNLRFLIRVVAEKKNPAAAGFAVKIFSFPIARPARPRSTSNWRYDSLSSVISQEFWPARSPHSREAIFLAKRNVGAIL